MRKINRDYTDKPALFNEKSYEDALNKVLIDGKKAISDHYFKGLKENTDKAAGTYKKKSEVLEKLHKYYYGKCAYCESDGHHDIEHYRPKKKVKEDPSHGGYYWLAYEWSNLIPSCVKCNRDGGKHDKFDIMGERVDTCSHKAISPQFLSDCLLNNDILLSEIPKLLHPEIDDPKEYFYFKPSDHHEGIKICPLKGTSTIASKNIEKEPRGYYTIETCKLNRENLQLSRFKAIREGIIDEIKDVFIVVKSNEYDELSLINALKHYIKRGVAYSKDHRRTYTLTWWYIMNNNKAFEEIVVEAFDNLCQKNILRAIYQSVKQH